VKTKSEDSTESQTPSVDSALGDEELRKGSETSINSQTLLLGNTFKPTTEPIIEERKSQGNLNSNNEPLIRSLTLSSRFVNFASNFFFFYAFIFNLYWFLNFIIH